MSTAEAWTSKEDQTRLREGALRGPFLMAAQREIAGSVAAMVSRGPRGGMIGLLVLFFAASLLGACAETSDAGSTAAPGAATTSSIGTVATSAERGESTLPASCEPMAGGGGG